MILILKLVQREFFEVLTESRAWLYGLSQLTWFLIRAPLKTQWIDNNIWKTRTLKLWFTLHISLVLSCIMHSCTVFWRKLLWRVFSVRYIHDYSPQHTKKPRFWSVEDAHIIRQNCNTGTFCPKPEIFLVDNETTGFHINTSTFCGSYSLGASAAQCQGKLVSLKLQFAMWSLSLELIKLQLVCNKDP